MINPNPPIPNPPIRVLVVDDHMMIRQGIATFIEVFDDMAFSRGSSQWRRSCEVM